LGTSAEVWGQRIQRLWSKSRMLGSYFSADRERLRQLARQRGVHHLDNVANRENRDITGRTGT
jgi:phage I-like protein